ncbi:hypothetical protein [Pseudomonas violetae]|uniref:Uncharacterized protein n=1 Tax=Pseudomonas violetae TaxID=2915813 RepID=A0ABT0EZB6_9PSED|nr:hypothetical protein [Pseudomonas violetae]MCK1791100.1 hypothetical protein [Pseudomonas violetae]
MNLLLSENPITSQWDAEDDLFKPTGEIAQENVGRFSIRMHRKHAADGRNFIVIYDCENVRFLCSGR